MNIQSPPPRSMATEPGRAEEGAPHAQGPPDRSARRSGSSGAADRPPAPPRSADRASASHPGQVRPHLRGASRGARGRDEAFADRGLRGRDLLRAFRRGEGGRDAAAAGHGAGVRLAVVRDGGRGSPAQRSAEAARLGRARGSRAVHGRVRSRAGLRGRPCAGDEGDRRRGEEARDAGHARACAQARHRLRRVQGQGRLQAVRGRALRQAHARRAHQDRQRRGPARAWRRGLPDRPQVAVRARRKGPAADGGERRRGRARHVQGPLLSRPRSAPLPRRHADRRLGGRGRRGLHLHPRRISRIAADAARRDRQARSARASTATPRSIFAAVPAPTSAAKSRR